MLSVFHLKSYLLHSWTFKRTVTHKKIHFGHHQTAIVEGVQTWQPLSVLVNVSRYLYVERGCLALGNHRGMAEQKYQFEFQKNDQAQVYFNDGRFFYSLDLKKGKKEIEHQCGSDHYLGEIQVISKRQYSCTWHVTGPQKDYCSYTLFSRKSPTE